MKKSISTAEWDAELDTGSCDRYNNADITLTLKLGFRQVNPSGGTEKGTYHHYGDATEDTVKIVKWTDVAWDHWIKHLVSTARKYWHGRFWLVNNFAHLEYKDRSVEYRPNAWCRLEITPVLAPAIGPVDAHFLIDAVRLDKSEKWFGSHKTLWDSRDTRWNKKSTDSKGKKVMQRAHVHEMGHILGLGHVDIGKPHCPIVGDTNAGACYGVADLDKKNVMGSGMARTANLARPWRRAMVQITGKGNANTPADWQGKLRRHYPRTLDEAKTLKAITARPRRS